jgi:signal transduction histidine kinase
MPDAGRDRDPGVGRLVDEQAALRRVATLAARGAGPEEIFAAVSEEVAGLFAAQAAVGRFDPDGSGVVFVGISRGLRGISIGTRWRLEGFMAATRVYRTGRAARTDPSDYVPGTGAGDALRENDLRSIAAAPIVVEGDLWGVVVVAGASESLPPDTETRLAQFTELAAIAIAGAESRAELAASEARAGGLAREQAALRRVATLVAEGASADRLFSAVAKEVADVLGIPVVGLHRFEADRTFTMMGIAGETIFTVGSRWPVEDEGIAGAILATGSPARKEDYGDFPGRLGATLREDRMVATVGVPIVVEGGIWGFMVGAARPGKPLPPLIEDRLARFTELVATAIANRQARQSLAQLADEQAALRRVATLVARGARPEVVFSAVSEEVAGLFGTAQAAVGRFDRDGPSVVAVGVSKSTRVLSVGTRWPLEGYLAASGVYRTGRPARSEQRDYENESGAVADSLRENNLVATVAAPIVVEGDLWGIMAVADDQGDGLPPDAEQRLEKFSELVGTAIANADSRGELAASRARVIAAGDDARRRIERDLHDGAQQRLVTLAVALRRAAAKIPAGLDELRADVARVGEGLTTAVEELRETSRGIHPAVLTEGGLVPALKALGRRSAVRVKLEATFEQRLPDQVEIAAYYTVSEAVTNAAKHAGARQVWVSTRLDDEKLYLSVRDDGVGGADPSRGSGLIGLRDRIEALGGKLEVTSPPGRGTLIAAELPVLSDPPVEAAGSDEPLPRERTLSSHPTGGAPATLDQRAAPTD